MQAASLEEPYRFTPSTTSVPTESLERQTRHEISQLVADISELCHSELPEPHFWREFSSKLMRALAADGAVIWKFRPEQPPEAIHRVGSRHDLTIAEARRPTHVALISEVASRGRPVLVPPTEETEETSEGPGNPSQDWVAIVPLSTGEEHSFLIEAFLSEVGGPSAQRGYLKFIAQMVDLASEYLRTASLKNLKLQREHWEGWDRWLDRVNQANTLAELRRRAVDGASECLQVARVSWLEPTPFGWQLKASTGIDSPDPRSEAGRWLSQFVGAIVPKDGKGADNLQKNGQPRRGPPTSDADNPTQLSVLAAIPIQWPFDQAPPLAKLEPHSIKETHFGERRTADAPPQSHDANRTDRTRTVAVLVFQAEQDKGWGPHHHQMAGHIAKSIAGALRATSIAAAFPWIGPWLLRRQHRRSLLPTFSMLCIGLLACLGLFLIPVPFRVIAPATLEPVAVSVIQAPRDGIVQTLHVEHGQTVSAQTCLLEILDPELDRQEEQLLGEQAVLSKRDLELQRILVRNAEPNRRMEWEAEHNEVLTELSGVLRELRWLEAQRKSLVVLSPRDGSVDGWEAKQKLVGRQVRRGEPLLRVFDPSGNWRVRTEIPQNRLNHVVRSLANEQSLTVSVVLRSFPDQFMTGSLESLGPTTASGRDGLPVGWSDIRIDPSTLPLKQQGASASVAIDCGYRPLGYVLFQDLIRAVIGWGKLWLA